MSNNLQISQKTADAINKHGEFNTGAMRLRTIRIGLRFEIQNPGMRLTAKAPKCSTILRKEFGLKGNPIKLLGQFEQLLVMVKVITTDEVLTEVGANGKFQFKSSNLLN